MKKRIFIATTVWLLFFCVSVKASTVAVQKQIVNFTEVEDVVDYIKQPEKALIVIDFEGAASTLACNYDNPTAKNCSYLGSTPWFNWQLSLLESEPSSEYLVAKDKAGLRNISNVLLDSGVMAFTEESIPALLESFSNKGLRVMFITQYGSLNRLVEKKAIFLPVNEKLKTTLADIMVSKSPQLNEPLTELAVCNSTDVPKVNYQNGVLYTAGEDKVMALECFLKQYNSQLSFLAKQRNSESVDIGAAESVQIVEEARKLIFIDNSYRESEGLYNVYRGNNDYDVFSLYYTKLEELWKPLLEGEKEVELQKQAHQQWLDKKETVLEMLVIE